MLRSALFVVAVLALIPPTRAADPDLSGNWILSAVGPASEANLCILKVETKDGKPVASVLFSPPNVETTVGDLRVTGSSVAVTVKQSRMAKGGSTFTNEYA